MAASIVTKEQVFTFCDEIHSGGETPTITLLYPRFNNRGGYSTISKYLKEWKEAHKEAQRPPLPEELPADLTKPVEHALRQVMAKIDHRANERIAEIEKASESDVKAVNDELAVATSEIARLEEVETENKATIEKLSKELEASKLTVAGNRETIVQLENRLKEEKAQFEKEKLEAAEKLEAQRLKAEESEKTIASLQASLKAVEDERDRQTKLLETMGKKEKG